MDVDVDIPRERSAASSFNNSRVLLIYSNISSISYYKKIEIQSLKLT